MYAVLTHILRDPVSMVDGDLFDKLARLGSLLRRDARPFGGIQVGLDTLNALCFSDLVAGCGNRRFLPTSSRTRETEGRQVRFRGRVLASSPQKDLQSDQGVPTERSW